jgi:RNA polymerase sigma-32 factor
MPDDAPRGSALVSSDLVGRYLSEIQRYPLLSREEERELAIRIHEHGDREAAEKLIVSNARLVVKIAMEYRRAWTNLLDLVQEGNVGLVQAARRYDPYRGVKFSSYAAYWIRAYILKYLIDNMRIVRMGTSRAERKLFFRLNRAKQELERAGFRPEPRLLAERLDVKEQDVVDFERRLEESDLSLESPVSSDGTARLGDLIDSGAPSAEGELARAELNTTLRTHVEKFAELLDERERQILRERILAEETDRKTLQEIANRFGLTRERVRQIESRLVEKLREHLKRSLVDFDYWAPED